MNKIKLIIVDDELTSRNTIKKLLENNDVYEVAEDFQNGKMALDWLRRNSADIMLCDMQMPEMDGCEAARRIRAMNRPDAGVIPIIAVTANAFAEDIAVTTAAGMNAHISKPIDFDVLRDTLARLITPADST